MVDGQRGLNVEAWHLVFAGRVQGVGFRSTCLSVAREMGLRGWVRNLPDRRVEAVVVGPLDALQGFVRQVSDRTHGRVDDVQVEPWVGERDLDHQSFEIIG